MPEQLLAKEKAPKICLLGASFDTGNLGVSALAESSIKCILNRWPDAEITLLASGDADQKRRLRVMGKDIEVRELPIRFSKNFLLENHFLVLMFYALMTRLLPWEGVKNTLGRRNKYYRVICEMDLAADVTGGDSFSDIYGMRRFLLGLLCKVLVVQSGKKLVMLPQTYGPLSSRISRVAARYVLRRASLVYSRDHNGTDYLRGLLKGGDSNGAIRFLPDVGFVLDSRRPDHLDIGPLSCRHREETTVVGFNVSGLLFNGGYTRNNMFGLKTDYRRLIVKIIELLLKDDRVVVFLIPHVFPPAGYEVESDPAACAEVFGEVNEKYPSRIFMTTGEYNHNEMRYVIGLCDFFIGSRMHSCIAAMSQCIPAVGIAYSRKFEGVFESIGLADCVVDGRDCGEMELLEKVESIFGDRIRICEHLKETMPRVKRDILNMFSGCSFNKCPER